MKRTALIVLAALFGAVSTSRFDNLAQLRVRSYGAGGDPSDFAGQGPLGGGPNGTASGNATADADDI